MKDREDTGIVLMKLATIIVIKLKLFRFEKNHLEVDQSLALLVLFLSDTADAFLLNRYVFSIDSHWKHIKTVGRFLSQQWITKKSCVWHMRTKLLFQCSSSASTRHATPLEMGKVGDCYKAPSSSFFTHLVLLSKGLCWGEDFAAAGNGAAPWPGQGMVDGHGMKGIM